VCQHTDRPEHRVLSEFEFIAYDEMLEWSDFTDEAPEPEERQWVRSGTAPSVGEIRIVNVQCPFNFAIGEEFWVLYQPPWSALNGWEDFSSEIELSALVRVCFTHILSQADFHAWIQVLVTDVIPVGEICDRFPARRARDKKQLPDWSMFPQDPAVTFGKFALYTWNKQSDVGGWYLVQTRGLRRHIILYDEWSFHYDNVYCGNVI